MSMRRSSVSPRRSRRPCRSSESSVRVASIRSRERRIASRNMRSDRSIVWLASYPKSGNTWLRILLANYMSGAQGPAGIDQLELFPIASLRRLFDDLVGIEASDLTAAEITAYRGEAYRVLAREHPPPVFVKVHDAYQTSDEGTPLFPAEITRCVVYVVRNPLDLVVSLA